MSIERDFRAISTLLGDAVAIAAVLVAIGLNRLDVRHLAPRETIGQLEKDKDTVKGMVR